ncbi:multiple coagulation factor deficiency protein 2 homolog [Tachypleus tridentatus]|uniref:multiple coagulation factor deficiency protein 2 homolog n=1 Tax=Tachypleus tridentatus TaxID=6853 RepID=UPI003FCEF644
MFYQRITAYVLLLGIFLFNHLTNGSGSKHKDHTHYQPSGGADYNILRDDYLIRDIEHLREDIQSLYTFELSENIENKEVEFYYFQLHDFDKNGMLDGLEILAALNHVNDDPIENTKTSEEYDVESANPGVKVANLNWQRLWNSKFEKDSQYIDKILKEDDIDKDGFLTYLEFAIGRRREQREAAKLEQ